MPVYRSMQAQYLRAGDRILWRGAKHTVHTVEVAERVRVQLVSFAAAPIVVAPTDYVQTEAR